MLRILQELAIFRELERRCDHNDMLAIQYRGQIESSFHDLARYLIEIRRYFHHYTDHSVEHSLRIVERIGRILTPEQVKKLSAAEIFILIATALVHDIGMVVSEREVLSLLNDPEFLAERDYAYSKFDLIPPTGDWRFLGVERLFVSDYIRRRHGQRCEMLVRSDLQFIQQLVGGNAELAKWVGRIAAGHTLKGSEVTDSKLFPLNVSIGYDQINAQFLVFCLRIGDLLDINGQRACPFLRDLSEPMVALSAHHWDQYKDIEIRNLAPSQNIVIGGTCPSQEAERILREWVSWLEEETERAITTLNTQPEQYRLNIGRIQYSVEPQVDAAGHPLYEFRNFRFNLDEEQIFKRLFGERLYGRLDVALRELLQNSIDATRIRVALECSAQEGWSALDDLEKKSRFRDYARLWLDKFKIEVHVEERGGEGGMGTEMWLHISDRGVGMSREVIEEYLLKVGRSRWRNDPRVQALHVGTIGEFGIGFLSTFMISERTIIETQSVLPNEEGIRATIYNWKGYLSTQPIHGCVTGTRVSLLIKREFSEQARDILNLVRYWCPFVEFIIVVKGLGCEGVLLSPIMPMASSKNTLRFSLPGGQSLAVIEGASVRDKAVPPSICQDGIIVADVPPPILEIPSQKILRQHGIRVDLRGPDRVRLDLSRNLVEGGADSLWEMITPRVWQGIVEHCLGDAIGRAALANYLDAEFERSCGKITFMLDPDKVLHVRRINEVEWPARLRFVDARNPELVKFLSNHSDTWVMLLPAPPSLMYSSSDDPYDNDIFKMDAVTYYWHRKGGILKELEAFVPSRYALTEYLEHIVCNFNFVFPGINGKGELTNAAATESEQLDRLSFWRMTDSWYAVKDPGDGEWMAVFRQDLDVLESLKKEEKVDLAKYVICIIYYIWEKIGEWTSDWAHECSLTEVGSKIEVLRDARDRRSGGWSGEDEDEYAEDDDTEGYEDDPGDEYEIKKELSVLALEILPRIDLCKFTGSLAGWDIDGWEKNRWGEDDWPGPT